MWGPNHTHFPNPLDYAQLRHFSPPTLMVLTVGHDHTPQPTPMFSSTLNLHLKYYAPPVGANLLVKGSLIINVFIKHLIHPIQILVIISIHYLSLLPPCPHQLGHGFQH